MPSYEYKCTTCSHHFEEFLKISESDNPLSEPCPSCQALTVEQVLTPCNFTMHGLTSFESETRKHCTPEFKEWNNNFKQQCDKVSKITGKSHNLSTID